MGIKQQFEMELRQKELMNKMGAAFKNISMERVEMEEIQEEVNDLIDTDINERRAQSSIIYQKCLSVSMSKTFNYFISVAIVLNTIVLSLDQYPSDEKKVIFYDNLNFLFYCIFLVEMIIKMTATGFRMYFKDNYNAFDFFVVFVSSIDIGVQHLAGSDL